VKRVIAGAALSPLLLVVAYPLGILQFILAGSIILRVRRLSRRQLVALAVIAAVGLYGVLIADDRALALWSQPGRRYGGLDWVLWLAFAVVLSSAIRTERGWRLVLVAVAAAGAAQSVAGIGEMAVRLVNGDVFARVSGLSTNAGFLGLWAMAGALAAIGLRGRWWYVLAAVCVVALALSGTRAAMLGLAYGLLVLAPGHWRVVAAAVASVAGAAAVGFLGERLAVWRVALDGFLAQPWGHGWYSFMGSGARFMGESELGVPYDAPHNLPLHLAYDVGVVGLAVVIGLVALMAGLRGAWLALAAGWAAYSLFWLPSPAWWCVGAVLVARALQGPSVAVMPSVRRLAADLAPPALLSLGRRAKQIVRRERPDFQGTYAGFDDIMLEPGAGFTDSSGLEWAVNKARAQSVQSEVVPDTLRLTILLNVLTAADSPVTVIDYGGGAGNTFVSVEPALANPGAVSWTIVELPSVAESARRFLGARATVSEDIDDALSRAKGTVVVLARGALQYHPRPFDVLAAIAGHQPAWVLLTRMPAGGAPRFACVQSFRGHTPQPMWFFNRFEMVAAMRGHGYALLDHWTEVETFRMPNYPPSQRVVHSVGWIFHRALADKRLLTGRLVPA